MTQFVIGVAALNHDSQFAQRYKAGSLKKAEYWQPTLDDSLDCVAKSFTIAARIYNNIYRYVPVLPFLPTRVFLV
jgi:citrate synthase